MISIGLQRCTIWQIPAFSSFTTNDLVITGSALALCWEVGSFLPAGGAALSYFSITEHIAFAVPALPFALLTSMAGFVGALQAYWYAQLGLHA
jgi:hypothetical protein